MTDAELDCVVSLIESHASNGDFKAIDLALEQADPQLCSIDFTLALLTQTLPFKTMLCCRDRFYIKALKVLSVTLLKGLE